MSRPTLLSNRSHLVTMRILSNSIAKRHTPTLAAEDWSAAEQMRAQRQTFLHHAKPKAPSTAGKLGEFTRQQADPKRAIHCDRPRNSPRVIPVTLLHPVFSQFLDNVKNHNPTREDNTLAQGLSHAMSIIYADEGRRGEAVRDVLLKAGFGLVQSKIEGTKFETDGDLQHDGHRYVIAEMKNEACASHAEPKAQLAAYYLESTRKAATRHPQAPLPCLLLDMTGEESKTDRHALLIQRF